MNADAKAVAVIGSGPVGFAAAAHALERGFDVVMFEAGDRIAAHLDSFRHVTLFSPWRFNTDEAAKRLLSPGGWVEPDPQALPTAGDMIDRYLAPLSRVPALQRALRLRHRVVRISKDGFDKLKSEGREKAPFLLKVDTPEGVRAFRAWSVIDATGTWGNPNPLGSSGLPAEGEFEARDRIAHGMPDILGRDRAAYAGKRVLVVGAGHSAAGDILALARLADEARGTRIVWATRAKSLARTFGGGANDELPARGELGLRLRALAESGRLEMHTDFRVSRIIPDGGDLQVIGTSSEGIEKRIDSVSRIVAATGSRPDLSLAAELRLRLDPWIESTEQLAPLIDPNVHSCGSVPPHGHRELAHPEARYFAVGAKSYGRATNFLMATGYEQVRSVMAALAGDMKAADEVRLELPETGVCSSGPSPEGSSCCGPAEAKPASATSRPVTIPVHAAARSCCG